MQDFLHIDNLSFTYENSVEPVFESVSLQLQSGWTGIVGANGSGKTTLLKLLSGLLPVDQGKISYSGSAYYCEQRTDYIPPEFEKFIHAADKRSARFMNLLDIRDDWLPIWEKLSHGERKRCQLATALFLNPSVLAIDEPTNHLDPKSRKILYNALRQYRGIGVLVSHDRQLLDNLCQHTLFLHSGGMVIRKCNYSTAALEIEKERAAQRHDYEIATGEIKKLKRQVRKQMEQVSRTKKMSSKSGINPRDHDAKSKIDAARLTGKDGVAGRIYKHTQNKLAEKQDEKSQIGYQKSHPMGIWFNEQMGGVRFPVTIQPDELQLSTDKILIIPDLAIRAGDKIGITGNNGSGKSSFLRYLLEQTKIPTDGIIYIPQEIPIAESKSIISRIGNYDDQKKGQLMAMISRLGSDPANVLETTIPTPGEIRKLLLAEGLMLRPGMIIMDEPTNHMDLPSMQCVEQALHECNCTQLLVSHDFEFLKNIVHYYWDFKENQEGSFKITVRLK